MADRQANINVNYNINTQQVAAATTQVTKAQQATDQWNKAIGQTGTAYSKTANQFLSNGQRIAVTIDGQKVQMAQLRAQIELTRQSDHKRLTQLTNDYKTVKASVDNFNKSLQDQSKQTQSLGQQYNALSTALRVGLVAVIAAAVKQTVEFQLEMAKLAGKVEGVERAFARLPQSTALLADLRRATHGTVTDLELMQQALRANNFEIDLKKLGGLLEFAATRAQQTGQEVDYLVNSIVMGIGMKSILRLDNLGLSATKLKEELGGVSVKAASVAEITRVVAKVAEESQEKLGGYFETSATKVAQLSTKWEEFKVSLSKGVGGSWLTTFLTDVVDSWTTTVEGLRRGMSASDIIQERLQKELALTWDLKFAKEQLNGTIDENISKTQKEIDEVAKGVNAYAAWEVEVRNLIRAKEEERNQEVRNNGRSGRAGQLSNEIALLKEQLAIGTASNGLTKEQIIGENEYLKLLRERLNALKIEKEDLSDVGKQLGIIEDLQDKIEAKEDLIKTATSIEEIRKLQRELSVLQKQLAIADASYNEFGKLKTGADKTIPGQQIAKIGARVENIQVPTESLKSIVDRMNQYFKDNPPVIIPAPPPRDLWNEAWEDFLEQDMLTIIASDIIGDQLKSIAFAEADAYDQRIDAAEAFYDRQVELAGEKYSEQSEAERARNKELAAIEEERIKTVDRLRKAQAEKEIKARRLSVIIDTAAGIAKAFATAATIPKAIIQAAIVAAYGASNLAIVNRQRANFADGVINLQGPGTERSDSIAANLSKGESVMTAKETRNSLGILKAIRAKKLDDRVLEQIKSGHSGGSQAAFVDNQGIISAINKQKYPDVVAQSGIVYNVWRKGQNYRQKVRAKSMGNG